MQFNDTTNKNGIIQLTEDYTDLGDGYISGDATRLKKFTAYANEVGDDLWFAIWSSMGSWQWDDSNQTNLPQATTDLVSGQSRYAMPTSALTIKRVEIKDENGSWLKIKPFIREKEKEAIGSLETHSGVPTGYFMINDTVQLYPKPNYASTGGLKLFFDRALVSFATSDTTKTPGIASPFHGLYPLGMAITWLKIKQPNSPSLAQYQRDYAEQKQALIDFYAKRWEDNAPVVLTTTVQNFE